MADLIDREKTKAAFEPWLKVKGYSEGELNMLKAVLYEITIMPSAERHGRWIYDRLITTTGGTYGVRRCSECESYYQDVGYGFNYCPNCGARMGEAAQ